VTKNKLFPYGTVLKIQREFSMEDIYSHMDKIKQLGMNYIVIWPSVFWWEEKSDNYPYNTGIKILKYADELDIKIIMETAGQITNLEYLPDFLMKKEYYAKNFDGTLRNTYKGYDFLNYNHPEVNDLIEKQFSEIATYYKDYSALYGYDIWNETMFTSYDKYTLQLFKDWLKDKYKNIDQLNDIWEKTYYNWSQINFNKWIWASVMPVVDYEQFHKENVGMILNKWKKIIKEIDTEHPIIADNIHSTLTMDGCYERPQDDWNVSQNVDEMGFSFYPKNTPHMKNWERWETLTGMRSSNHNKVFWISEMQSHHQAMYNPSSLVGVEEIKWWNWEAISHGAKGIIYWKWVPFIKGVQTFGRGLVDYRGEFNSRTDEIKKIINILDNNKEFSEFKPPTPKVAILYDSLNHDFSKAFSNYYQPHISNSIYLDSLAGLYEALWEQNILSNFVTPNDIDKMFSEGYKVLFINNQLNFDNNIIEALTDFVNKGGVLICTGRCGFIKDNGILNNKIPGGKFNSKIGCTLKDISVGNLNMITNDGIELQGFYEKQLLDVNKESDILASYEDENPAIIRNKHGKGEIIYISTYLWYGYYQNKSIGIKKYLNKLTKEYNLKKIDINNDIKINYLQGENGFIIFIFNYEDKISQGNININNVNNGDVIIEDLYTNIKKKKTIEDNILQINYKINEKDVKVYKIQY